uniref:tRNA pseudouridine(55) synthase n=1 Tax=Strigamia maritima TaxID=126957 RepID=T1IW45_STRMM
MLPIGCFGPDVKADVNEVGKRASRVLPKVNGPIEAGLSDSDLNHVQITWSTNLNLDREILKIGHGGTLDSNAQGVLVVGLGDGCRLLQKALHGIKKYQAVGELGTATDTFNECGKVTQRLPYDHVTEERFLECLKPFHGHVDQAAPIYSALKVGGERMSDLARKEIKVEAKLRRVFIKSVKCTQFSPPVFKLEIVCGGGCYTRSIVNDIGKSLDTCAHQKHLIRLEQKPFVVSETLHLDQCNLHNVLSAIQMSSKKINCFPSSRKRRDLW